MEPTPEQIETIEGTIEQSKCGCGCRFEAIGYLGRLGQIKALEALLASWRERGETITELHKGLAAAKGEE